MTMSAAILQASVKLKLSANPNYAAWSESTGFENQLIKAVCEAVVEHITSLAVVTVTSVSGVTTGTGTSGPGTGTIA
jgi:hypothetical protein